MTRRKVKFAYIVNNSARKATYYKRKRGLLKKMNEVTTLCDVKACAILYSSYEDTPVLWPNPSGALDVISSYQQLEGSEKARKTVNQEEFLRLRVAKVREKLDKQQRDNRVKHVREVMFQCLMGGNNIQDMSLIDLEDLNYVIDESLGEIKKKIEVLRNQNQNPNVNNNVNMMGANIINNNVNIMSVSNNSVNTHQSMLSGLQPALQLVGQGDGDEGLQGQNGNLDIMKLQMMMTHQPWSSYMAILGHQTHSLHQSLGNNVVFNGAPNTNANDIASTSNINNNNNMGINMMMMMDQQGNNIGDNQASGSNHTFLP